MKWGGCAMSGWRSAFNEVSNIKAPFKTFSGKKPAVWPCQTGRANFVGQILII